MTAEEDIQKMIGKFERRMAKDEEAREKVREVKKSINIDLGEEHYSFRVEDSAVHDFKNEALETADITLITTPENLHLLVEGELRPMRAYVTRKIVIKGKIEDILHLKSLF